jgi:hypothetical protein
LAQNPAFLVQLEARSLEVVDHPFGELVRVEGEAVHNLLPQDELNLVVSEAITRGVHGAE